MLGGGFAAYVIFVFVRGSADFGFVRKVQADGDKNLDFAALGFLEVGIVEVVRDGIYESGLSYAGFTKKKEVYVVRGGLGVFEKAKDALQHFEGV